MRCARFWFVPLCGIGLLACTHDFDAFDFDATGGGNKHGSADRDGGERDAAVLPTSDHEGSDRSSDADLDHPSDAGPHAVRMDAGDVQAGDAETPAVGPSTDDDVTTPDTGVVADAGHGSNDAAVPPEDLDSSVPDDAAVGMCNAAWSSASLAPSDCSTCACASCADPVTACLSVGTALQVQQCADVLACAIEHDCKDWSCYCTVNKCGAPGASGDGPCVAQMEAAAGGQRAEVMSIREGRDPNQPLVRAMNAIGCVLGLDPKSPGGAKTGQCDATCP